MKTSSHELKKGYLVYVVHVHTEVVGGTIALQKLASTCTKFNVFTSMDTIVSEV